MNWQDRGRCGQLDRDLTEVVFFGQPTARGAQRHRPEDVEFARNLCEACPVAEECLSDALGVPARYDRDGIRAGLLPGERAALRKALGVAPRTDGPGVWIGGDDTQRSRRGP